MVTSALAMAALGSFFLQSGDRVAFFGDSITEFGSYTNFLEAAIRTRYPKLELQFANLGWAGDTTWGSTGWEGAPGGPEERCQRDIAPFQPTVITCMLGMNDAGYVPFGDEIDKTFREWYGKLLTNMKSAAPSAKVILFGTTPWDDFARTKGFVEGVDGDEKGYNAALVQYVGSVEAIAKEGGAGFLDLNQPVADAIARAALINPTLAESLIPDRIHPSDAAGMAAAAAILQSWNFEPDVAFAEVNQEHHSVVYDLNCTISNLDGLSWTQVDDALPLPIDPADDLTNLISDPAVCKPLSDLNRERLRVSGLEKGAYRLTIDDEAILTADSATFEEGINLALLDTPMRAQSLRVLDLVRKKNRIAFLAWREVGIPFHDRQSVQEAVDGMEKLVEELDWQIDQAAQPVPHRFRLEKV